MVKKLLSEFDRVKQDSSDDSLFYLEPRLVYHLDINFRARLTQLYRDKLNTDYTVLDLMSSWVSHLPSEILYKQVIGHGLNELELMKNERLDRFWVQDLNKSQKLPLADNYLDACLMVAAWQYLQYPEELAHELRRVIKPGGKLIVSFSNRAFWAKAPRIWSEGSDTDHIKYVSNVLDMQGWSSVEHIIEKTSNKFPFSLLKPQGDPFFSVIAIN